MLSEKIHSPKFYLGEQNLAFINAVASFYNISRSEVVEWAICASIKPYDKAFKIATRRIYARSKTAQKIQNAPSKHKKNTNPSQAIQNEPERLFDPRAY